MPGIFNRVLQKTSYAWAAVVGAIVLFVLNAAASPSFLSPTTWAATAAVAAPFILVAMSQVPVMLSGAGELDLSVGPFLGVVGAIMVKGLLPAGFDEPYLLIPAVVILGAASGALFGWLIAYLRIPAIIVTLGGYLAYSGLAIYILPSPGGTIPSWLKGFAGSVVGVPIALLVVLVLGAAWSWLSVGAYGRNLKAVGGDIRAAYTSGVPVARVRLLAYMLCGVIASIAGLMLVSVLQSAAPTATPNFTLIALAGAALGGVSLMGGRGGALGAAFGGAILFLGQNFLSSAHVSVFYIQIFYGAILIAALALNLGSQRLSQRMQRVGVAQ